MGVVCQAVCKVVDAPPQDVLVVEELRKGVDSSVRLIFEFPVRVLRGQLTTFYLEFLGPACEGILLGKSLDLFQLFKLYGELGPQRVVLG